MEPQRVPVAKSILRRKNKDRNSILFGFNTRDKATGICRKLYAAGVKADTLLCGTEDKIPKHIYDQMIFKNGSKYTPWKKGSLFNNQHNGKAPTEQETTLGRLLSEKELISNIYMTCQNFIIKKKRKGPD